MMDNIIKSFDKFFFTLALINMHGNDLRFSRILSFVFLNDCPVNSPLGLETPPVNSSEAVVIDVLWGESVN